MPASARIPGRLGTAIILLRSVYATLRISVPTIYEVYRGTYRRSYGDARLRWWSRRLLELIELDCKVVGAEHFALAPGKPTILMSNHQSLYDIPLIFVALPGSIRMLTKKELFRVPIWGRGMKAGEFVAIDRHDRKQHSATWPRHGRRWRTTSSCGSLRKARVRAMAAWVPSKRAAVMLALETGARIIPIGIHGADAVLPAGTWNVRLGLHCRGSARRADRGFGLHGGTARRAHGRSVEADLRARRHPPARERDRCRERSQPRNNPLAGESRVARSSWRESRRRDTPRRSQRVAGWSFPRTNPARTGEVRLFISKLRPFLRLSLLLCTALSIPAIARGAETSSGSLSCIRIKDSALHGAGAAVASGGTRRRMPDQGRCRVRVHAGGGLTGERGRAAGRRQTAALRSTLLRADLRLFRRRRANVCGR
jgi:1-acyl-sn-glycerol-3-phosphate acyltransferase